MHKERHSTMLSRSAARKNQEVMGAYLQAINEGQHHGYERRRYSSDTEKSEDEIGARMMSVDALLAQARVVKPPPRLPPVTTDETAEQPGNAPFFVGTVKHFNSASALRLEELRNDEAARTEFFQTVKVTLEEARQEALDRLRAKNLVSQNRQRARASTPAAHAQRVTELSTQRDERLARSKESRKKQRLDKQLCTQRLLLKRGFTPDASLGLISPSKQSTPPRSPKSPTHERPPTFRNQGEELLSLWGPIILIFKSFSTLREELLRQRAIREDRRRRLEAVRQRTSARIIAKYWARFKETYMTRRRMRAADCLADVFMKLDKTRYLFLFGMRLMKHRVTLIQQKWRAVLLTRKMRRIKMVKLVDNVIHSRVEAIEKEIETLNRSRRKVQQELALAIRVRRPVFESQLDTIASKTQRLISKQSLLKSLTARARRELLEHATEDRAAEYKREVSEYARRLSTKHMLEAEQGGVVRKERHQSFFRRQSNVLFLLPKDYATPEMDKTLVKKFLKRPSFRTNLTLTEKEVENLIEGEGVKLAMRELHPDSDHPMKKSDKMRRGQ